METASYVDAGVQGGMTMGWLADAVKAAGVGHFGLPAVPDFLGEFELGQHEAAAFVG